MAHPITHPSTSGSSLKEWLRKYFPEVADELDAAPAHRYARVRDMKDSDQEKKHPARSGRVP